MENDELEIAGVGTSTERYPDGVGTECDIMLVILFRFD